MNVWKSEVKTVELALSSYLYVGSGLNSGLQAPLPLSHLVGFPVLTYEL